jgi:S-phase kinase-associated protein 1
MVVPDDMCDACMTIKNLIEDLGSQNDEPIPVPNLSSLDVQHLIDYFQWKTESTTPEQEVAYFDEKPTQAKIGSIIPSARYLVCDMVCTAATDSVVKTIKGIDGGNPRNTLHLLREELGVVSDFTPEEEEEILRKNAWAFR